MTLAQRLARYAGVAILSAMTIAGTCITLLAIATLVAAGHWVAPMLIAFVGFSLALAAIDRIRGRD